MIRDAIGSSEWLENIFASPPARETRGRSRPTHRYLLRSGASETSVAEGGNTACARSLLMTMHNAGIVKRWKLEPFTLSDHEHGVEAVPDVLFELCDTRIFVAETKSARFLTAARLEKCQKVEAIINQGPMRYLLWTDSWPLSGVVKRQIVEIRRHGSSRLEVEMERAIEACGGAQRTFADLRADGIYRPAVLAAVWHGRLHIDLFSQIAERTVVSKGSGARRFHALLTAPVGSQTWWASLARAHIGAPRQSVRG